MARLANNDSDRTHVSHAKSVRVGNTGEECEVHCGICSLCNRVTTELSMRQMNGRSLCRISGQGWGGAGFSGNVSHSVTHRESYSQEQV